MSSNDNTMHRRTFLTYLLGGVGAAVVVGTGTARAAAPVELAPLPQTPAAQPSEGEDLREEVDVAEAASVDTDGDLSEVSAQWRRRRYWRRRYWRPRYWRRPRYYWRPRRRYWRRRRYGW